jgi:hypothetical protein
LRDFLHLLGGHCLQFLDDPPPCRMGSPTASSWPISMACANIESSL